MSRDGRPICVTIRIGLLVVRLEEREGAHRREPGLHQGGAVAHLRGLLLLFGQQGRLGRRLGHCVHLVLARVLVVDAVLHKLSVRQRGQFVGCVREADLRARQLKPKVID